MIDFENYTYIDTSLELVLTHSFELSESKVPTYLDYKCKICGAELFEQLNQPDQSDKAYALYDNFRATNLTCNEILINNIIK